MINYTYKTKGEPILWISGLSAPEFAADWREDTEMEPKIKHETLAGNINNTHELGIPSNATVNGHGIYPVTCTK